MDGTCSKNKKEENFIQHLVRKPKGKRKIGRPRHGWDWGIPSALVLGSKTKCGLYNGKG